MKKKVSRRQLGPLRFGLLGLLIPLTLVSTAQTPPSTGEIHGQVANVHALAAASTTSSTGMATAATALAPGFDVARFEMMAQQLTLGERIPGMALAIVHNGKVLTAKGYGVTDVSAPQAIDSHTVFRLASLSKAFAGTLAGLLVNDGSLRWDSKVADYVPNFHLSDPAATQRVTVADLLSHRVGLRAHNAFDRDIEGNADYYTVAQKLSSAPMTCLPGQCYAYQNVAFSLFGDVVFASTGGFYEQAVDRRIFKPLGMNDASLGLAGIENSARWARPHVRSRNGWVAMMPKPTYYRLAPAAGVNASISDMAQWLVAQTGHRPDVLPAPMLATLHAPLVSTPGEMRAGWRRDRIYSASYALGWRVFDYSRHPVIFHAGAVQGYRGMVALLPERDLGIAILWNSDSAAPSGLLPTILDQAMGLPPQQWLDTPLDTSDLLMADSPQPANDSGTAASQATASPR
ncbi:serine hydrolase domain-containing protein [Pseudoxanthomonas indica]|uniref:Beta-lactamase class C n=1 Tax=Pseudoxanthomonas indica TaxID=428993 RepID=A0A1T5JPS4_9GAMM|nr:serine hydrolase domain-containing protein [Pseudoxanthomonas indica]GGD43535.1 serine hydrolase [Pseudoxanthomonas indica]SKC53293.1 beta-lactamase class C [Pseudoxanthomonas indica]